MLISTKHVYEMHINEKSTHTHTDTDTNTNFIIIFKKNINKKKKRQKFAYFIKQFSRCSVFLWNSLIYLSLPLLLKTFHIKVFINFVLHGHRCFSLAMKKENQKRRTDSYLVEFLKLINLDRCFKIIDRSRDDSCGKWVIFMPHSGHGESPEV